MASRALGGGDILPLTWHVEHDSSSLGEMSRAQSAVVLRYTLGGGRASDQFAAAVAAIAGGLTGYDRLTFTGRADHAMRVAVQLRPAGRNNPPRWQRSVYLDETRRTVTIAFVDMQPVARTVTGPAPLASIDAVMFVVDTNNTRPATSGVVTIDGLLWERLH